MIKERRRSGIFLCALILISFTSSGYSQPKFNQYFTQGSIRLDLVLAGNHESSSVYLDEIRGEPFWGGSKSNLLSPFDYGEYRILVRDDSSKELIYTKGFCTFFEEWQTVAEAKVCNKAFDQIIHFPMPLKPVNVEIQERDEENIFRSKFITKIDPADPYITRELKTVYPFRKIQDGGPPETSVDIVFIAEGYTESESEKFYEDVKRLSDSLMSAFPFKNYQNSFNIYAVAAVSEESGTDFPGLGIWKKTALNSNFYTFKLDRYLTTEDCKAVRDAAANVPYDNIVVLVNSKKYGGGGIFNHYSIVTSDNRISHTILIHEFGHGFGGLADEYYTSDVSYEEFFKLDLEPWQPNLTTLIDFKSKWKGLLDKETPVPTPAIGEFSNSTGVFEGGGYSAKGIYRPALDCRMKSNLAPNFCEVCQDALTRMIKYHTE
jgi:hypothetical protein